MIFCPLWDDETKQAVTSQNLERKKELDLQVSLSAVNSTHPHIGKGLQFFVIPISDILALLLGEYVGCSMRRPSLKHRRSPISLSGSSFTSALLVVAEASRLDFPSLKKSIASRIDPSRPLVFSRRTSVQNLLPRQR